MRISTVTFEKYDTTDRRTGRAVKRYRARWRFYPAHGAKAVACKRSGFETKGLASTFVDTQLRKAELGVDGWRLDPRGYPTRDGEPEQLREVTTLDLVRGFLAVNWKDRWAPGSRSSKRGRLLAMVALTVDDPAEGQEIMHQLQLNARPGKNFPRPTSRAGWVADYLRNHTLRGGAEVSDADLGLDRADARRWLEEHSLPLTQLNYQTLLPLHQHLRDGVKPATARSYWTVVAAVLAWGRESGQLSHDPEAGLVKSKRDSGTERVDPRHVPGAEDIQLIADRIAERAGKHAAKEADRKRAADCARALVLVKAHCALRIGELLALRRSDIEFSSNGGAIVTIYRQDDEQVAADSDDGATTLADSAPKGRTDSHKPRRVFLARVHAEVVRQLLDTHVGDDHNARLFLSRRGTRVSEGVFRRDIWSPVIADLFPAGHRLHGITPHALRAAGMTLWLRSGVSTTIVQEWGGWASLKVMLDVYAGVLPDDHQRAMEVVEAATSQHLG